MYRVYLFVIGICICCPLIGAKEPLHLLADPTPTVTLDMKRVPLQDILLEIEKQTGLFFSYESSMLKEFRHVSLTARDESLSYCLKRLFEPLPLVYRITGRYVILKRKPRQYTISGFVRDSASYESLIAATVVERSSGKGSVSNNYGFYSITLPPGKVVLSSSYVGYEPCSVTFELTCDTMIDLSLSPAGVLGEVVIKGISPRSDVLNSRVGVSDVPASRVKSLPALLGETDVVKTLQRLPGVTGGTEGMSGLFVRGGDGDDNLFLLDGNPVYHTDHVLGFFSAFNPDAVKNATFYKEIDKWYENYIDELFAYGIAFGVEKDFVLDAIHDLFLHLFESADKIEILGSPKSYLFSALKNKIITSLRKQANWLSLDEEVEYDFKIEVDAEALMEDEEERRNYEKEVENLLNLLTNKQREVIYLRFIKALSIQEISEILNITPKSVRKMIYRAIERMQQGKIELLFLLMFLR